MSLMLPQQECDERSLQMIIDFVKRETGIDLGDAPRKNIERKLVRLMQELGYSSCRDLVDVLLDADEALLQHLIDALTVTESYFFREEVHFRVLSRQIMPKLLKRSKGSVRIWCAGCARGEEPYTLAMYLLEDGWILPSRDIRIYATDINRAALQVGRDGLYSERSLSFRNTPPYFLEKYFERPEDHLYRVRRLVRDLVEFSYLNLVDREAMGRMRDIDVIFCRNVLYYFNRYAKKQVVDSFHASLNPGGFLFISGMESLHKVPHDFEMKVLDQVTLYQKRV